MKITRILLVGVIFCAVSSVAFAAQYWVVRGPSDKLVIVESQPEDAATIVKGPFPTRAEAEVIISGPAGGVVTPAPAPAVPPPPAAPKPPPLPGAR